MITVTYMYMKSSKQQQQTDLGKNVTACIVFG